MDYQEVIEKTVSAIIVSVERMISSKPKTEMYKTKITKVLPSQKYEVVIKKKIYIASSSIPLTIGDGVWVCVPQSNWNDLFVVTKTVGKIL